MKYNLRKRSAETVDDKEIVKKQLLINDFFKIKVKLDVKEEIDEKFVTKTESKSIFYGEKCSEKCADEPNSGRSCPKTIKENYSIRSKLDAHFRMHSSIENRKTSNNDEEQQVCNICDKFINASDVEDHELNHSKLKCKFCGKISINKWRFKYHQRIHIKKQKHPCKDCDETFEHFVNLARHISVVHKKLDDPKKTECPLCKKVVSAINAHLRTHQDNPRDCELCGATLKNYSAYKAHKRYHGTLVKQGRNRVVVPKSCFVPSRDKGGKRTAQKKKATDIRLCLFPCPYCEDGDDDQSFSTLKELVKHVSVEHRKVPEDYFQCPCCAEIVSDIGHHMRTDHRQKAVLYECEMCDGATFTRRISFWKHFNKKHKIKSQHKSYIDCWIEKYNQRDINSLNLKKVHCFLCLGSIRVCHMSTHIRRHHRTSTFACSQCHKLLPDREALDRHRQNHSSLISRSNSCPVCAVVCITHLRLLLHMKSKHRMLFSVSRRCVSC